MKIKIISDASCNLFIDQEMVASIPANQLTVIPIDKGEYILRYECIGLPDLTIEKDLLIEYDKIERISFIDVARNSCSLYEKLQLIPQCNNNHRWGFVVKGTDLNVIPYEYEEAESFGYLGYYGKGGGPSLSIVKKDGKYGVINMWGLTIVPFNYKTISRMWHYFCAFNFNGDRHIISDDGYIFIQDKESHKYLEHNLHFYGNALEDFFVVDGGAYYPNGERIIELGKMKNAKDICWRFLCYYSPYYIIYTQEGCGIARVDRNKKETQWVSPSGLRSVSLDHIDGENTIRNDICHPYAEATFNNDTDKKEWTYLYYPTLGILVQLVSVDIAKAYLDLENPSPRVPIPPPICSGLLYYDYEPKTHYYNVTIYNFNGEVVFAKDNILLGGFMNYEAGYEREGGESGVLLVKQFGEISEKQ